jgi:formiminotetrahydrofolate cyclodeaminase
MPAISSECERAFSAAKKLINEQRYNLKTDIIEADQCIKSWLKNGIANGRAIFNTIAAALNDEDDEIVNKLILANKRFSSRPYKHFITPVHALNEAN